MSAMSRSGFLNRAVDHVRTDCGSVRLATAITGPAVDPSQVDVFDCADFTGAQERQHDRRFSLN